MIWYFSKTSNWKSLKQFSTKHLIRSVYAILRNLYSWITCSCWSEESRELAALIHPACQSHSCIRDNFSGFLLLTDRNLFPTRGGLILAIFTPPEFNFEHTGSFRTMFTAVKLNDVARPGWERRLLGLPLVRGVISVKAVVIRYTFIRQPRLLDVKQVIVGVSR